MFPIYSPDDHLPNFQKVSKELFRGGQPTPKGFAQLSNLGVQTIINLRDESRLIEEERRTVESLNMEYVSIPLSPFRSPKEDEILRFLKTVSQKNNLSFVHCWHGMDRTGTLVSIYRIHEHGWEFGQAYAEMLSLGFHEEFFHLRNCVSNFARKLALSQR